MGIEYEINTDLCFPIYENCKRSVYSFDSTRDSFGKFLKITTGESFPISENYSKMLSVLEVCESSIAKYIPREVVRDHAKTISKAANRVMQNKSNALYLDYYLDIVNFLKTMKTPLADESKIKFYAESQKHDGPRRNIEAFLPTSTGFSKVTEYCNARTATGRLTVVKGPNILTAPSEVRNCFKSRFKNGSIFQIDIISAEPKFALYESEVNPPIDVYNEMNKILFSGEMKRSGIKIATLCALYGQSPSNLSKSLPPGFSATRVIQDVKNYFGIKELQSRLLSAYNEGDLRNALGRPLSPPDKNTLVSYYLQSSVAEAAILMFKNLCDSEPDLVPLYVIHDALIVDAKPRLSDFFLSNKKIDLVYNRWKFTAEIKFLGDN